MLSWTLVCAHAVDHGIVVSRTGWRANSQKLIVVFHGCSCIFEDRILVSHSLVCLSSRMLWHLGSNSSAGPKPFLNFNFRPPLFMTMGWPESVSVPIESWFMRRTRLCTRTWLMFIFGAAYIIALAFIARANWFTNPANSFLTCPSTYWSENDGCGLDGQTCAPFDNVTFEFRCPAQCASVILQNPRAVGAETVDFVPLIVGGGNSGNKSFPGSYRGDSFICAAAIHASAHAH